MGVLDQSLSNMTLSELTRLISREVSRQVPAIPASVAELGDADKPILRPAGAATDGQSVVYDEGGDTFVLDTVIPTDGVAPIGISPTPTLTGSLGVVIARWTAMDNPDPVGYDVHIGTASGFVPSASTKVGSVVSTSFTIKASDSSGSALAYGTDYYVKVYAFDNDGLADGGYSAASNSAQLIKVQYTDISVTNLQAISADMGALTAGSITLANSASSYIQTASSGGRVVLTAAGLTLYAADGTTPTVVMTAADGTATFTGTVYGTGGVIGPITLQDGSIVDTSSTLTVRGSVGAPLNNPGVLAGTGGSMAAATYYVGFTWYDGASETTVSPRVPVVVAASGKVTVTLPPCPALATQARIYMNSGSTFAAGGGHLQVTVNPCSTTATTVSIVTSYTGAGASSPASSTFSLSTVGTIEPSETDTAGTPYWYLGGDGRMKFLGPTMNKQLWVYSDFFEDDASGAYPAGLRPLSSGGGSATATSGVTPITEHQGVWSLTTGTAGSTDRGAVGGAAASVVLGLARTRLSCLLKTPGNLSSAGERYMIYFGLIDTASLANNFATANGVGLRYSDNVNSGKWQGIANDGGTNAVLDTGITTGAATWYFLEFEVLADASAVTFYIDGVDVGTITSARIPDSVGMRLLIQVQKAVGTGGRAITVDAYSLYADFA